MKHYEDTRTFLKTLGDTLQDDKSGISTKSSDTQAIVDKTNAFIEERYTQGDASGMEYLFNGIAAVLARANIAKGNGGPFGAVIVQYDKVDEKGNGIGKPRLLGVGANHVVPKSDPSAHAEMEAYRDAGERRQASDLKNCVMFTSCECCPMCLATGNTSGIGGIVYSNDRGHAERINFADKAQYDAFQLERAQQMSLLDSLDKPQEEKARLRKLLEEHEAVVLDRQGNVYATGSADTRTDPTGLASLNAIRNAVKRRAQESGPDTGPIYGVPEGSILVTRQNPHPAALVGADWADVLRDRGVQSSDNAGSTEVNNRGWGRKTLQKDAIKPIDPRNIIYLSPQYEQLTVYDNAGKGRIAQRAEETYIQPTLPDAERAVPTRRCDNFEVNAYNQKTFLAWDRDKNKMAY